MDEKSDEELIRKQSEKFEQEQYSEIEKKQRQTHPEVGEDATQYGEFVSSYFAWISLPNQKEKVEEMSDMTKEKKWSKKQNGPRRKSDDI